MSRQLGLLADRSGITVILAEDGVQKMVKANRIDQSDVRDLGDGRHEVVLPKGNAFATSEHVQLYVSSSVYGVKDGLHMENNGGTTLAAKYVKEVRAMSGEVLWPGGIDEDSDA